MTGIERRLDARETAWYRQDSFPFCAVEYEGNINVRALELAFRELFNRYAVLRGRIIEENDGAMIRVDENFYPEMIDITGNRQTFPDIAENLKNSRAGAIAVPLLVRKGNTGFVSMGIDHTVIDGAAVMAYTSELWQLYTNLVEGKAMTAVSNRLLPAAPSSFLGERTENFGSIPGGKKGQSEVNKSIPDNGDRKKESYSVRLSFDSNRTKALVDACKRKNVGVSTFLGSVLATVLRDHSPARGSVPFGIRVFVDHRADRYADATKTTYCLTFPVFKVNLDRGEEPFALAQDLKKRIAISRDNFGDIFTGELTTDNSRTNLFINGAGKISVVHPKNIRLIDFDFYGHAIKKLWLSGFQKKLTPRSEPTGGISCYTFNSSLIIRCNISGVADGESVLANYLRRVNQLTAE